ASPSAAGRRRTRKDSAPSLCAPPVASDHGAARPGADVHRSSRGTVGLLLVDSTASLRSRPPATGRTSARLQPRRPTPSAAAYMFRPTTSGIGRSRQQPELEAGGWRLEAG